MAGAIEIAEKAQRVAAQVNGGRVQIIGSWIWVDFPAVPAATVRDMLRAEGFRWNWKRECWQFAGTRSTASPNGRGFIEAKYGVEEVEAQAVA